MDISNIFDDDLLELEGIEKFLRTNHENSQYTYDGHTVPRVTRIINTNENQEGLIRWAASVGYYKYNTFTETALEVGTNVHSCIDDYLVNKYHNHSTEVFLPDYGFHQGKVRDQIYNAYNNFIAWDKKLEELGAPIQEVIGIEVPLVCPWFGGTCDAIVKINNANYLIDFKTSKAISHNYLVQASAYMWMINNRYCPNEIPNIDGIGIIRVDKNKPNTYNDLFLNNFVTEQRLMIESFQQTFAAYIASYYRGVNTEYLVNNYTSKYNMDNFFKG